MKNYREAVAVCAVVLASLGGWTAAHAAGARHPGAHGANGANSTYGVDGSHGASGSYGTGSPTREVDRNLVKPPPGGVLAPVADAASRILPR
jgi:hypothetical protein